VSFHLMDSCLRRNGELGNYRGNGNNGMVKNMENYYVYLLASKKNGTIYCGATHDLLGRVWQHKNDLVDGFTKTYGVHTLVYYQVAESKEAASNREKQLKAWKRQWKVDLIQPTNPTWRDLYDELT
jgi:putative endonuclease